MSSYTTPTYPSMDTIQPNQTQTPSYPQPVYQPPIYPQAPTYPQTGIQQPPTGLTGYTGNLPPTQTGFSPFEQSYIENILRLNKDKIATVYMNFENAQWASKVFKGAIEAAGKDHIILRDPVTNMRYLLLTIFLNYITFDEEINYQYPFVAPNIPGTSQSTQLRKKDNLDHNQNK